MVVVFPDANGVAGSAMVVSTATGATAGTTSVVITSNAASGVTTTGATGVTGVTGLSGVTGTTGTAVHVAVIVTSLAGMLNLPSVAVTPLTVHPAKV